MGQLTRRLASWRRGTRAAAAMLMLATVAGLGGCGASESYRYKLTLEVETPDGIKTGVSVVEERVQEVSFPASGAMSRAKGEAVLIDLGPGRPPLVAVMQVYQRKTKGLKWAEGKPYTEEFGALYGVKLVDSSAKGFAQLKRLRGPRALTADDLPDLVTFDDVADPRSVRAVDPHNLAASLGAGIRWHKMTLEVTTEPVTTGIEKKLPWVLGPWVDVRARPWPGAEKSLFSSVDTYSYRKGF